MSLFLEERRPSEPLDFLLRLRDKCFIVVTQESARGGKGFANQFDQANLSFFFLSPRLQQRLQSRGQQ